MPFGVETLADSFLSLLKMPNCWVKLEKTELQTNVECFWKVLCNVLI